MKQEINNDDRSWILSSLEQIIFANVVGPISPPRSIIGQSLFFYKKL